jgi:GAF domain-containing protein
VPAAPARRVTAGDRLRETETLLSVSQALGSTLDLTEVLRRVSRETARAFGADTAGAFLAEADEVSLRPIAGYHVPLHLRDPDAFTIALRGHPLFEAAWTTRQPIAATDAAADPRLHPALRARLSARSLLFVPMVAKDVPIGGLLLFWWAEARVLSAQELRLVEGIGRQAGLAVANARLFTAQQEDAEVARALLTLAEATGTLQELGRMLDTVAWVTPQLLGVRRCGVFLWEAATGRLVPTAAWGLAPEHAPAFAALAGSPRLQVVLRAIESREPVVVDAEAVPTAIPAHIRESLGIESVLVLPLVASGRLMGTMAVDSPGVPHVFTAKQVAIARGIAAHAAVAIRNAALYAETERRRRVAEELAEVGRVLSETLDPDVVGQRIVDSLRTLLGATASSLQRLDDGDPPPFRELARSGESFPWGSGIVRVAVRTREAVVTPDVLADPRLTPTPEVRAALQGNEFRAVLAVPLTVKDRVIGALAVSDRTGHVFDPEASALARIFADQAAVALENARLFRETGDRLRETETLLEVAQALSRGLPQDEAMRQVARAVGRAFGADIVGAYFLAPGTETLVPIAGYRVPKHLLATLLETPFPLARFPILQEAWQTGRPVWTSDYPADPRVDAAFLPGVHPRALLFAPTPVRGEVMGGLFVAWWTRPRVITPAELRLIEGVASQVGLALENAELGRQTQEKLRETETLLSVARAVSSTLDLQPLLRHFLRQVARTSDPDSVGVWLLDELRGELVPHTGYRVPKAMLDQAQSYRIRAAESAFYAQGIASRRALVSTDVPRDDRIPASLKALVPHRTQLFGPIVARQRVVGAFIAVWYERTREFSARELALIEAMGSQAGVALENARLFQAHQRELAELSVLYELSRAVTGQLDLDELARAVHRQIGRVLDARNMVLFLYDAGRREFEPALRMFGGKPDGNPVARYPMGVGLMSRVAERRQAIRTTDYAAACRAEGVEPVPTSLTLPCWLGVPLIAGAETLGVLVLRDAERAFTQADERLLTNIAGVVAVAVRAARLFTEKTRAHDELRSAQEQLIQSERLRALGEMAAGVAHDFNNILAAIMGRAQLLLTQTEEPGHRRQLQIIERAAMDGARTVRRIQEFARKRRDRPFEPVDLNQIVEEVVEVTRSRWDDDAVAKGIDYEVRVDPTPLPWVAADPSELREVVTNLVLNALDAMPDGGRVTLTTGVDGETVVCTVTDTGIGMTEEVRQRVFDPFFTTKAEKGTGLGLSVAYGIVTRHGGEIEVRSQPWRGSSFTVRLPVARQTAPPAVVPGGPEPVAPARILVIEDEENVRQVLAELLMAHGHTVVSHADGRSGLARFHDEPFDVVFTDLGMPGLSGWEVARVVKLRRPAVPVVLVTGWSDQMEPEEVRRRGIDFVVAKPFEASTIRRVVSQALAARAG